MKSNQPFLQSNFLKKFILKKIVNLRTTCLNWRKIFQVKEENEIIPPLKTNHTPGNIMRFPLRAPTEGSQVPELA